MSQNLILGLSISIMFNVFVIMVLVGTGIGKDAWQRFWWKIKHRSGKHAYTLMATKSGNIKEVFAKIVENKFTWNEESYVRNPRITRNYRGIPANFHREGCPTPIDPWAHDLADWAISTGELDDVMVAGNEFDLKEWLDKNKGIIAIVIIAIVGLTAVNIFFGYSTFQMMRDGGLEALKGAMEVTPS